MRRAEKLAQGSAARALCRRAAHPPPHPHRSSRVTARKCLRYPSADRAQRAARELTPLLRPAQKRKRAPAWPAPGTKEERSAPPRQLRDQSAPEEASARCSCAATTERP